MKFFRLDVFKAVQAIGVLLHATQNERLEYLSIIKMLYIADRESWKETGSPITYDLPMAMKNGPVLSGILDLVNLNRDEGLPIWATFIHKEDYDLQLKADPGTDRLSPYEVRKLNEIGKRYADKNWRQMIDLGHNLPEWKQNDPRELGLNYTPIPLEDILTAVGRDKDASSIMEDEAAVIAMRNALGN